MHKTIVFVTHDLDEAMRLGDRMAVLNVGGVLEQYGAPVDVLAEPASPFVTEFLGADRGLKRLALIPVSAAELQPGPTIDASATTFDARTVMRREGVDWVAVLDDGRPRGWVGRDALDGHDRLEHIPTTPFPVTVHPDDSLRHALDALVSSPTQVVIVVDADGRYLGLLDVARIGKGLHSVTRLLADELIRWSWVGDHLHEIRARARAAPRAHVHRGRRRLRDLVRARRDRHPVPHRLPADQRGRGRDVRGAEPGAVHPADADHRAHRR